MAQVFLEYFDFISTNLTFQSGIHVQHRLVSVDLQGPRKVYLSRIPLPNEWSAKVVPFSYGNIFIWSLKGFDEIISVNPKFVNLLINPGINELKLTVWNSFGHLNASMLVQVAFTLIALNYSFSDFLIGRNGSLSVTVNQLELPDAIFVDFGDGNSYDSTISHSAFHHERHENNTSTFTIMHTYQTAGLHVIYFNASNSFSHFEQWTMVNVAVPISGVKLELLSPSTVALFEEVIVQCLVEKGSDIDFDWDFGDGTDGQYTMVNSSNNSSIANHSYGVADIYNITVHIFNDYETVSAHLNISIQAVEPIKKLHLRPRFDQYAAPLRKWKSEQINETSPYSTDAIVFEAWVWRGSDIQFLFNFGDGQTKLVSSERNVWSLPCATVKHFYSAEGSYDVSVTATNPLDSLNQSLSQPFFVQFAPEDLMLDKQYYIVQYKNNLSIHASISQGTNVSFIWTLDNELLNNSGNTLLLNALNPGVHIISVEVSNKVTDFAYKTIQRPSVSSKIYVQEKLQEIKLCLLLNGEERCRESELELPFDEEIIFVAKVLPSTERSLRFTWQLGVTDLLRTNKPFLHYLYQNPGRYIVNVTAQNHISSTSSPYVVLHLIQKIANLTSIYCQGPNLVNYVITFHAFYWFGTNLTFQWDFGDGSAVKTTHSSFIEHIYKEVGEYWVSVNVWNKFSHANISTNMFFLHHFCQKPDILFLHETGQTYSNTDDILIEAEISTNCETNNVKYNWRIERENGSLVPFANFELSHQRYLIIPQRYLLPGIYVIHLRVEMSGVIVYAESSMTIEIVFPIPVVYIKGGYLHWIGGSDIIQMETHALNLGIDNHFTSFTWSCLPLIQKHLPCFQDAHLDTLTQANTKSLIFSASSFTPGLSAVTINSTVEDALHTSASQIIEIKNVPHVLVTVIDSDIGHDHQINQDAKIHLKASCQNCSTHVQYEWKVWRIEGGQHKMHYSNYECVQADGSTFFIMSPNSTLLNSENNSHGFDDIFEEGTKKFQDRPTKQLLSEDLPPFPILPGFPEELNFPQTHKRFRSVRHSPHDPIIEPPSFDPFQHYPFEEEAHYDVNSTFFNLSYPDFLPMSPHGHILGSPDYPIPEEGAPGESGSAVARDQSSQRFKIHLSENEGQIEEGAGKPRIDGKHVFGHETNKLGDPVRDSRLHERPTVIHLINRPRIAISLSKDNTSTGFKSAYFTLKPGVLRAGHSYFIQVSSKDADSGLEGFAMELVAVNSGPFNGRCTLMPTKGYSLNFNFRLHCMEWKSDNQPLYYELRYSLTQDKPGHLIYFGLNTNAKFVLPAGLPSESFNVYLNVIIRNNLGASTKVCSLIREVKPLNLNATLIQYIYNETFHPQSQMAKYMGEKQNQALLHQIHILSSSLNNYGLIKTSTRKDKILKEQIRFRFLETIENLKILSKVEAVQTLSSLSEIVTDVSEITMFELQKVYNIYNKLHSIKSELHGFTSEALQHEFMILISKLIFASHSVYLRNEELIRIGRQQLIEEVKDMMKLRWKIEEPLIIKVPHIYICALYILNFEQMFQLNPIWIPLKLTEIQIFDNFNVTSVKKRVKKCSSNDCIVDENCIALIAQELDYVSMPHYLNFAQILPSKKTSILFSLLSCDTLENIEPESDVNFTVRFSRNQDNKIISKFTLFSQIMNFHQINVTDDDIHHSFLFHLKIENMTNVSETNYRVEALFRYENWPTPRKYNWKQNFPLNAKEQSFFIPQDYIKAPGIYYFALWAITENKNIMSNEIICEYSIFIWKEICLGKSRGIWSTQKCYSQDTTNYYWSDCRCSANEITSYSVAFLSHIFTVPLKDLMEPYFNVWPVAIFIFILLIYVVILVLNFYKDKMKKMNFVPVPLIDNSNCHKQLYVVCVKTGMYFSSGTTASVFVVLHGMKGMTETRQLIDSKVQKLCFQKGSIDLFLMSTEESLGPLMKLEIWHNNYGVSPSWFLKNVTVKDVKTGVSYYFDCCKWLSAEKGDGQIERELTVSDAALAFCSIFWDNFITYIHDFNMWNAVICESPASFYTGVQRLTCCLCFCLNCAFIFAILIEQGLDKLINDYTFPHISESTFPICLLVSAIVSVALFIFTVLFRYSKTPSVNIDPKFSQFFCFLSLEHLYCWLQHKRSNSSRSSDRSSSSVGESDSFYSSFEESSVMSIPELMEESFSTEEKDEFPTSISSVSINDPVSPLQKTLSTWQAFENWVRKKHDLIKSDVVSGRQPVSTEKSDSVLIPEEIMLEDLENHDQADLNEFSDSNSVASRTSELGIDIKGNEICNNINVLAQDFKMRFQLPFLHSSLYYVAWFLLVSNILLTGTLTMIKISSFSFSECTFWVKHVFLSLLCSFLIFIPCYVLLLTVISSVKTYLDKETMKLPISSDQPFQETDINEINKMDPSYKRIQYFKKYLRPPREQILEQFRQTMFKEKIIFSFQSYLWKYIAMLVLLLVFLFPEDTHLRYLQKSSIINALFRGNEFSKGTISINSSLQLSDWFEFDFIDGFFGRNQCLYPNIDCGITVLTGCNLIGSVIIRLFEKPSCINYFSSNCETNYFSKNVSSYYLFNIYEHRLLKGHFGIYDQEDEFVLLNDNIEEAEEQIDLFLPLLLNITSGAISVEFLLFNPSFSTLISISFLFEITELEIMFTKEIETLKLHEPSSLHYHINFILHLLFILIVFVKYKNMYWRILKYGFAQWRSGWNYFSTFFNVVSTIYIIVNIVYVIKFRHVLSTLIEKDFDINLNILIAADFEALCQKLLTFLVFLHLIGSLRILYFSSRLKKLLKTVISSWKVILSTFFIFILLLSICDLMTRNFFGVTDKLSHPLVNSIKGIGSIFKVYRKPEIVRNDHGANMFVSNVILLTIITIHVILLAFLRSILIRNISRGQRIKREKITLKETKKVLERKLTECLKSVSPQVISKDDYVLPVDFLLIELEQLAETLLTKANNLFIENEIQEGKKLEGAISSSAVEGYLNSQCQLFEKELTFEFPISKEFKLDRTLQQYSPTLYTESQIKIQDLVTERLNATMPRLSKSTVKNLLPSSLNASVASQRKFKHFAAKNLNFSSSLPHKIRKTYPLYHLDSDSSSSDSAVDRNATNGVTLRKTKSRGKGKNNELNLNILDDSVS
ncbi:polycystic kidney disease 1 like 1 [Nephila pilipes]|uniref:Polycystic kidney disease 1 like 1 n=1 Tax=Nephila pilipes TaxID=299642 RepID=A0A8X6UAZ5_NEPPI|nr:polycystic kidney disease 1 like 1 [Nephila pilipes]